MILFTGNNSSLDMLIKIHPKLLLILADVNYFLAQRNKDLVLTSIIRPQNNDSGIHALGRAFDISIREMNVRMQEELVNYINNKYSYSDLVGGRKVAILNDGGNYANQGVANHIHFQVGG